MVGSAGVEVSKMNDTRDTGWWGGRLFDHTGRTHTVEGYQVEVTIAGRQIGTRSKRVREIQVCLLYSAGGRTESKSVQMSCPCATSHHHRRHLRMRSASCRCNQPSMRMGFVVASSRRPASNSVVASTGPETGSVVVASPSPAQELPARVDSIGSDPACPAPPCPAAPSHACPVWPATPSPAADPTPATKRLVACAPPPGAAASPPALPTGLGIPNSSGPPAISPSTASTTSVSLPPRPTAAAPRHAEIASIHRVRSVSSGARRQSVPPPTCIWKAQGLASGHAVVRGVRRSRAMAGVRKASSRDLWCERRPGKSSENQRLQARRGGRLGGSAYRRRGGKMLRG
jgi:hypothetical protein